MKKMFTKLFSAALLMGLTVIGFSAKAQSTSLAGGAQVAKTASVTTDDTKADEKAKAKEKAEAKADEKMAAKVAADPDTAWKPQRRVWGYTFGDFYYDAHSDNDFVSATGVPEGGAGALSKRGAETNYSGVPTYRNAFQFRRIYLGYDYEINQKFKAEFLLASEPAANSFAITLAMVLPGPKKTSLKVLAMALVLPISTVTAIVSPNARPRDNRMPANKPERV